ncbi:hypothetical protein NRI_0851 [Neorickettsia risticii str. Illinois]|uniref:Uncharacterized protein n=1 Tax=Neorickettsia risticii (strain Illinois) TaxID=434131 RepID=C6V600_NEORI|nr:hypothetical protein NRI_0851 [Neorickettsia risticii str. Illinois]
MTATTPTPLSCINFTSLESWRTICFTYGQWLQINITSVPLEPAILESEHTEPLNSIEKGGALKPSEASGVFILTIIENARDGETW